ncbi:MAG: hypothetical protein ABI862_13940, partial [Ilumatobacteraceae bacterium]
TTAPNGSTTLQRCCRSFANSNRWVLYFVAHNALRGGSAREALEAIRRAITLDGEFGPALDLHATLLADAGRTAEALSARRRAMAADGSGHDVDFLAGLLEPFACAIAIKSPT